MESLYMSYLLQLCTRSTADTLYVIYDQCTLSFTDWSFACTSNSVSVYSLNIEAFSGYQQKHDIDEMATTPIQLINNSINLYLPETSLYQPYKIQFRPYLIKH